MVGLRARRDVATLTAPSLSSSATRSAESAVEPQRGHVSGTVPRSGAPLPSPGIEAPHAQIQASGEEGNRGSMGPRPRWSNGMDIIEEARDGAAAVRRTVENDSHVSGRQVAWALDMIERLADELVVERVRVDGEPIGRREELCRLLDEARAEARR